MLGASRRAALVLALLAIGCASPPVHHVGPLPERAYNESIDIGGRFSVQFQHADKPESWSGSFSWTQSPQLTTVTLQSPFGQTLATIVVDRNSATLTQSGKPPRRAVNVDALVQDALGWPLPIANLRDWLQGYAFDAKSERITATPQLTEPIATRDGWRLRYVSWQDDNEIGARDVPKRIDMERTTAEAGDVQMRLVISTWQAH
jgi:outer membrane lipoprotein LolB